MGWMDRTMNIFNPTFDPTKLSKREKIRFVRKYPEFVDILEGEKIKGFLNFTYTPITHLPKLEVSGSLHLSGCTTLRYLSEGIKVDGNLFLNECTALRHLPEWLKVGTDLYIRGCTLLPYKLKDDLPKSIEIKGRIMWV